MGCRTSDEFRRDFKNALPDVVDSEDFDSFVFNDNSLSLPDMAFQNVTIHDIEQYYRKVLTRGAVYFVGFDISDSVSSGIEKDPEAVPLNEMKFSFFVTGTVSEQVQTVALKLSSLFFRLNDDYYIVRSADERLLKSFDVSSVYVSDISTELFKSIATLYELKVETNGVQFVVRGPLNMQLEFSKVLKTLNDKSNVYLVDLAFIDFSIDEASNFQAYLASKPVDFLVTQNFNNLFAMYLDCSVDNLRSRDYFSQSLLASDGKSSVFDVGNTHSREQRAITDQGTSTVSNYNEISDGFKLTFKPQLTKEKKVICTIELENSAFKDDTYNNKSETTLNIDSVSLELGKTYFLSSFSNISKRRSLFLFGVDLAHSNRNSTCWVRVRKIK